MINKISTEKESDFKNTTGSHKNNLLQMNLMSSDEIDFIIDSIIGSPNNIVKDILGKNVYQRIFEYKPDIFITKKKKYIKEKDLDFDSFETKYINDKKEQFEKNKLQEKKEKKKEDVNNLVEKKLSNSPIKQELEEIKEIRSLLKIIKEKKHYSLLYFSNIVKIDPSMLYIAEKISNFFVENNTSYKNKFKKQHSHSTAFSFLKENGEPNIEEITNTINSVEKKISAKISKIKEKIKNNIDITEKESTIANEQILLRKQEAKDIYLNKIKKGTDVYYSEKEIKEGEKISKYIQEQLTHHTCPSFSSTSLKAENLTSYEDLRKGGRTAIKIGDIISVDKGIIDQIDYNQKKLTDFFLNGDWNMRDYILNRFVEYIAMEIIPYSIAKSKKELDRFSIIKTSSNDDSFGGADFVIKETTEDGETDEVWLDLGISNNEESIKKKCNEAEKKSFLIDSFLNDISENEKPFTGFENVKTAITFDPLTFYPIFVVFIDNLKQYGTILGPKYKNIGDFLDIEATSNPYSQVEKFYKTAYKALYNHTPKHEFSENFNGFITNASNQLLQAFGT